jgi:hypothetical protein
MSMKLMIHTVQVGDALTMVGPDGQCSERFTLAELPRLTSQSIWIYREFDAPIVVDRGYGLDSSFVLHSRNGEHIGRHRAHP